MYDDVLLPTDGSDAAETAARAAVALARRFDATLRVVHVLEAGDLPPGVQDSGADEFASRGESATRTVAEMATDAGLDVTTALVDGQPTHRAILAYADREAVDCIVMGTVGRTGLDRFVLGSVTERTLRESTVPVFTVHADTVPRMDFEAVLVPTDGSDCAEAAADHAIALATETGASLHVVHAVDPGVAWGGVDSAAILDALEEHGERAIRRVVERAADADVSTVEAAVVSGPPSRAIVDYADEQDVDLVVMGTHGRTGLDRHLIGSVTERVVRRSRVPVLALAEDERDEWR
jgi:nucleotide-binding universal stress UspA family protein